MVINRGQLLNEFYINNNMADIVFLSVSGGSNKIHKVLKPFSVVDFRRPQVFQAVGRAENVTVDYYMIGRLLLSATDAFRCF